MRFVTSTMKLELNSNTPNLGLNSAATFNVLLNAHQEVTYRSKTIHLVRLKKRSHH